VSSSSSPIRALSVSEARFGPWRFSSSAYLLDGGCGAFSPNSSGGLRLAGPISWEHWAALCAHDLLIHLDSCGTGTADGARLIRREARRVMACLIPPHRIGSRRTLELCSRGGTRNLYSRLIQAEPAMLPLPGSGRGTAGPPVSLYISWRSGGMDEAQMWASTSPSWPGGASRSALLHHMDDLTKLQDSPSRVSLQAHGSALRKIH